MNIALVQMTSTLDYKVNLEKISYWFSEGIKNKVYDFFLPESFYSFSDGIEVTPYFLSAGNEHEVNLLNLVKKFKVRLWGGSCIYKINHQYLNRALFINEMGKIVTFYDKMHLFFIDNRKEGLVSHDEASRYTPGKSLTLIKLDEEFKLGASICYDVRFPELYRKYSKAGANVLTVSSAFTVPTGRAHWHTMLRSRAIENLSYVIASAQWGQNNQRLATFGHSLVVSPWGEVLCDMGEGEGVQFVELKASLMHEARTKLANLWSNFL